MGIFDKLKHEFIDIIEWLDDSQDTILYRFERYQNEIKYGAKLVVRESQVAVFVNEGQIADVFNPGTYTLETKNMPILTTLKGWKYGFNSPFKAEVYFVSTKQFTDRKWGTKNPIMMRDPEFGPIRLRAFGNYSIRIKDAGLFIKEVAGTNSVFTTDGITDQLKNIIITRFTDILGSSKIPALDLASNYDEISIMINKKIAEEFTPYGLELVKFLVENISLPPEVEEAIDKRTSMGVIGNLNQYAQFQAANAMEAAAKNPSGGAGEGIGMGMGFGMASQMAQGFFNQNQQGYSQQPPAGSPPPPPPMPTPIQVYIAVNGQQQGPFDVNSLKNMVTSGQVNNNSLMWMKGMSGWKKAVEINELKDIFTPGPPPIPSE